MNYNVMLKSMNKIKKHTPVNQSCSVAYDSDSRNPERYLLTVTYDDGSSEQTRA